jgi:CRISPR-associated endonuclease/helicase Cas3
MTPKRAVYFAHSKNDEGICNPLSKHLAEVAERAKAFAAVFGAGDTAQLAGLLHDLGKYGELFQRRLEGKEKGLDHWSIGASVGFARFRNPEVALVVQGHHVGLQWCDQGLRQLFPADLAQHVQNEGKRLTELDRDILLRRLAVDGLQLPTEIQRGTPAAQPIPAMLDIRMLYSTLTDADYLATERHFAPAAAELRCPAAELNPRHAADLLKTHLQELSSRNCASQEVSTLRNDLLQACLSAAAGPPGLFTLTAPTGAGKTLSTLAFALRHAAKNGLRRIVVVMPFLSIIDQTVQVYRDALSDMSATIPLDRYILEHHSLAVEPSDRDIEGMRLRGLLTQNWDAPIVITTSVQILESLFSNSPSACRKLHRLANSIVIFDEVQTLPLKLVQPTLAALSQVRWIVPVQNLVNSQ